jgi:hypothetical protein
MIDPEVFAVLIDELNLLLFQNSFSEAGVCPDVGL